MWSVVISLVPVIAASIYFFGPSALLVTLTCVAGCLLTERLFGIREAWEASSLPSKAFKSALARPVEPVYAMIVLGGWTAGALLLCYRRVVQFSRSASDV